MMQSLRRALTSRSKQFGGRIFTKRECSQDVVPSSESEDKGNTLFSLEQKRQLESVGRMEKIRVEIHGKIETTVVMMNKDISTPYDCCRHISLPLCLQSPLALINDTILWDMHRPLPGDCKLTFLSFRDKEPYSLNEAFWRTGSFVLGAVIKKAFKEEAGVKLLSFPKVMLRSGSFIYDAVMNLENWDPTVDEIKVLSAEFLSFVQQNHKIERLDVQKNVAFDIFDGKPEKQHDVKKVAAESGDNLITLYRVGNHIDVCSGPLIGDTNFFGRVSVTAVHPLRECTGFPLYRFQGIALPKGIMLNCFAYGVISSRAQKLNEIEVPYVKPYMIPYGPNPKISDTKAQPYASSFNM